MNLRLSFGQDKRVIGLFRTAVHLRHDKPRYDNHHPCHVLDGQPVAQNQKRKKSWENGDEVSEDICPGYAQIPYGKCKKDKSSA